MLAFRLIPALLAIKARSRPTSVPVFHKSLSPVEGSEIFMLILLRLCFQDGFPWSSISSYLRSWNTVHLLLVERIVPSFWTLSYKDNLVPSSGSGMVERFYHSLKSSLHSKLAGSVWIHHLPAGSLGFALCSDEWSSLFHCRSCLWFPFGAPWNVPRCSGVGDILWSVPSCRVSHSLLITLFVQHSCYPCIPKNCNPCVCLWGFKDSSSPTFV